VVNTTTGTGGAYIQNYHNDQGAFFAFADAHVEFLSRAETLDTTRKLMSMQ
jgi:hypothetical protein